MNEHSMKSAIIGTFCAAIAVAIVFFAMLEIFMPF